MKFKISTLLTVLYFYGASSCLYAQYFPHHVIASSGTFTTSASGSMAWTLGEITIETCTSIDNFLTQGFHQPSERATAVVPTDFFIPEGFSPNDDVVNDLFIIRGIDNYPKNTFVVLNRWGTKLFEASPYQNNWDGKAKMGMRLGEGELPTSTYFYLLDLGDGSEVFKGTIYLIK